MCFIFAYRVIHEGLDTAECRGVNVGLSSLPVHGGQQVQQAVQPVLLVHTDNGLDFFFINKNSMKRHGTTLRTQSRNQK
jgi:hypothetical protein